MKILHTSDWHVGKRIGRYDRMAEFEAVLAEVREIADREAVDLVIVSGDLFDRPSPPIEAMRLVIESLVALADGGSRPVVAVAGNHDSADLFEVLAPLVEPLGVSLVGQIKRPLEGGVITVDTSGGRAAIAAFPFLREGRVVDFMEETERWYGLYADRVRELAAVYADAAVEAAGADGVALLAAHFMVTGAAIGGHGVPRGERALHIGKAYAATEQAIPPVLNYVAMGHIHAPQKVPGASVPAEYAGSLLELDFGEAGETKRVVLVETEPGIRATTRSIPLTAGRRLVRASGTWEALIARPELTEAYVDLIVDTAGADPGLADRARQHFPYLVKVEARYERAKQESIDRTGMAWDELFADYLRSEREIEPSDELLVAFRSIQDEALAEDTT